MAGIGIIQAVLDEMNISCECDVAIADGDRMEPGQVLCTLTGLTRDLLTAERIILNFLSRLCGVATQAARYVALLEGTSAKVYDTRKRLPGGGVWKNMPWLRRCIITEPLFDAILTKTIILQLAQKDGLEDEETSVAGAIQNARDFLRGLGDERAANTPVEIEVDTLDQLERALPCSPDIVLLDNMTLEDLRQAVAMRNTLCPGAQLEASGGVTFDTLRSIAETGVDRISVGALTHSVINLDLGFDS